MIITCENEYAYNFTKKRKIFEVYLVAYKLPNGPAMICCNYGH